MPSKDIFHSSANFHIVCSILGAVDICRGNIRAFHILSVGGAAHIWWSGLSTGRLLTILSNCVLTLTCSTQHFANTHLLHHSTLLNTLTHSLTKLADAGKLNTLFTSYCTGTGANMHGAVAVFARIAQDVLVQSIWHPLPRTPGMCVMVLNRLKSPPMCQFV